MRSRCVSVDVAPDDPALTDASDSEPMLRHAGAVCDMWQVDVGEHAARPGGATAATCEVAEAGAVCRPDSHDGVAPVEMDGLLKRRFSELDRSLDGDERVRWQGQEVWARRSCVVGWAEDAQAGLVDE